MILHRFGIGLALSKDEQQSVAHITDRLYEAFVLVNDYYSWDVEYAEHSRKDKPVPLVNAVYLISQAHSLEPSKAKHVLKMQIRMLEKKYCSLKKIYLKTSPYTPQILRWFDVVEQTHAGTALWSCTTARYNRSALRPPNLDMSLIKRAEVLAPVTSMAPTVSFGRRRMAMHLPSEGDSEKPHSKITCVACKTKLDERVCCIALMILDMY
jgi:hypothetical protein